MQGGPIQACFQMYGDFLNIGAVFMCIFLGILFKWKV